MIDRMVTADRARDIATGLMVGMGTPISGAAQVAQSLVSANLAGHDSHGLLRLPWYWQFVVDGRALPAALPVVQQRSGATAVVDGRHGWGQVASRLVVDTAAEIATRQGIAVVTAHSCNHVGRLGEYAETLAARGLISIMWCNADPAVAPFGGRQRMLGTNPFAAGVPAGTGRLPVIVDFATAGVAEGKLRIDRQAGRSVAPGLIQDSEGRPSTDPEAFYAGGALLPFGAHKGFGLAVLVELLGGALSGNHVGFLPSYSWGNGLVLMALEPGHLIDADQFATEIADACETLRSSPTAAGVESVLLPGDVERRTRAVRDQDGIPVPEATWQQLHQLAAELGVSLTSDIR